MRRLPGNSPLTIRRIQNPGHPGIGVDVNSFGLKVSEEGEKWDKDSISGGEKQAYEIFKESFLQMINSVYLRNP